MIGHGAPRHWAALDAVFSRTVPAEDLAHARQTFAAHVAAVSDVSLQLFLNDAPGQLRGTGTALTLALHAAWSDEDTDVR